MIRLSERSKLLSTTCFSTSDFAASWGNLVITSRIGIGNWVFVIPGTRSKPSRQGVVSKAGLREALLDTDPATAFNPFLGFRGRNSAAAISRVYVTLQTTGEFELPLGYFHLNGDLFNLPAGPVSFAAGVEYHGERWRNDPDSENTSFDTIGSVDFEASRVNRDVWTIYQEVRIPVTSPAWKFPGAYSLEFDIAEREEWYSQNTSATTVLKRSTPSLTRRSRSSPCAGSRLTPAGLARLPYGAVTAKGFMRRHYPI